MITFISYFHNHSELVASIRSKRFSNLLHNNFEKLDLISQVKGIPYIVEPDSTNEHIVTRTFRTINSQLEREGSLALKTILLLTKMIDLIIGEWSWLWSIRLFFFLNDYVPKRQPSLIIITGGPFLHFLTVFLICSFRKIPYVLDYRDSWTSNPHSSWYQKLALLVWSRIEFFIVKRADLLITASQAIADSFRYASKKSIVIYNFPSRSYASTFPAQKQQSDTTFKAQAFKLIYTGSVFRLNNLSPLCKALRLLDASILLSTEFHYYGLSSRYVSKTFDKYDLTKILHDHGLQTKSVVLSALTSSNLAICTAHSSNKRPSSLQKGEITTKIFDYIITGKPTIVIAPSGLELLEILDNINSPNVFRFSPCNISSLVRHITRIANTSLSSIKYQTLSVDSRLDNKVFQLTDSSDLIFINAIQSVIKKNSINTLQDFLFARYLRQSPRLTTLFIESIAYGGEEGQGENV